MRDLKIRLYGDPVLRKTAKPVKQVDDAIREFARKMILTMHKNDGIGLAAPQVGRSIRLVVVDVSPVAEGFDPMVFVNPEVIEKEGSWDYEEGCLSIPNVREIVNRPEKIKIRYTTLEGDRVEAVADDILGRVLLHEIDHLNGVLFIDYLDEETRKQFREQLKALKLKSLKQRQRFKKKARTVTSAP